MTTKEQKQQWYNSNRKYANEQARIRKAKYRKTNKALGYCYDHSARLAISKTKCQECLDNTKKWQDKVRRERKEAGVCRYHPNKSVIEGKIHCEQCLDKRANKAKQIRIEALKMIMKAHGIFECHRLIHPHMPEDLKQHLCWGELWIEHPNGWTGPIKRKSSDPVKVVRDIVLKKVDPKIFMVLCQLHQIWNFNGAILRRRK